MPVQKRKLLLIGGKGMLARKIASAAPQDYEVTAVDLPDFDMTNTEQVSALVKSIHPEIIINCAAFTNVDGCETEQAMAERVNGFAVGSLADAAQKAGAVLVHVSTDYIFDGEKKSPYLETDEPCPKSAYGRSKLLGEQQILGSGLNEYYIVRTSWLYGPGGSNFVETIIRLAAQRDVLRIINDQVGTPTYTGDLAAAIFNLLDMDVRARRTAPGYGIYHFSGEGQCSWYEFAREIITLARLNGEQLLVENILPIKTAEYPLPAKRPAYSVFSKEKYIRATGAVVPAWQESLAKYFAER
jgi:dTDP-4-dehydrorhamnose reductase